MHTAASLVGEQATQDPRWADMLDAALQDIPAPMSDVFPPWGGLLEPHLRTICTRLRPRTPTQAAAARDYAYSLTPREQQVLRWVSAGLTDREIASQLGVATRTVSKHVERILEKTHTETRAAAVAALADVGDLSPIPARAPRHPPI